MYVRANSSIPMFTLTVTCRTNPVRVPDVIVRMCPLAWPSGLQGQVNPLASSETTVLKTSFGPGDGSQSCPSPKVHARLEALTAARYLDSLLRRPRKRQRI